MSGTPPLFRSSAHGGFSEQVRRQHGFCHAIKNPGEVDVQFATDPCVVHTREGTVQARAGDAILTGTQGERWRVTRVRFANKYQPVGPTRPGCDGRYAALPIRVGAVQMHAPFEVLLSDNQSRLTGEAGDWLLDYGDGSLGIIAPEIFLATYRIEA